VNVVTGTMDPDRSSAPCSTFLTVVNVTEQAAEKAKKWNWSLPKVIANWLHKNEVRVCLPPLSCRPTPHALYNVPALLLPSIISISAANRASLRSRPHDRNSLRPAD